MDEYYFKLEANHIEDDRVMRLMDEQGVKGFGAYMMILCVLRKKKHYRCDVRALRSTATRYMIDEELLKVVVEGYDLFEVRTEGEVHFLVSPYLLKAMENLEEKRAKRVAGGKIRANTATRTPNGRFASNPQVEEESRNTILSLSLSRRGKGEEGKLPQPQPQNGGEKMAVADEEKASSNGEEKTATPTSGWEYHVAMAAEDREWLKIAKSQTTLPLLERTNDLVEIFKRHARTQGQETTIYSTRDAKNYMANFYRRGTQTCKWAAAELEMMDKAAKRNDPYRFEERDPETGKRYYCGLPIPDDAPPRPDENAIWLDNEWTR